MTGDWEFEVLDYPKENQRTDYKDFFRVYVAPGVPRLLGLEKGDPCSLEISGKSVGVVVVWEVNKGIKTRELQIPKRLQALYKIGHRAKASLFKVNPQLPDANSVTLHETPLDDSKYHSPKLRGTDHFHWEWLLKYELYRAETVSPGMVLEGIAAIGQKRSFRIQRLNGSSKVSPHRFQQSCEVQVVSDGALDNFDAMHVNGEGLVVLQDDVGGLEAQIKKLNMRISSFADVRFEESMSKLAPFSPRWMNGIILHGPSGTGKSHLLRKIGEAGWRSVFDLGTELSNSPSVGGRTAMRKMFGDAKNCQPSVILIDDLDNFAPQYGSQPVGQVPVVTEALHLEMERLGNSRTLVVATTRSLTAIDQKLRSLQKFSHEIELPVPDLKSRTSILKKLSGFPIDETSARLDTVARRTHGFVGADLAMLVDVAARETIHRIKALGLTEGKDARTSKSLVEQIEDEQFEFALREVHPSAMREVFVEIHETRWSDIGGQDEVKEILHQAIVWPSKYSEDFKAHAIAPSKGLLLYGPPGCSKTMTARAAATESGYNFIAVRGAELLNMYVGESERKIREYFHLARSVSPSILFFDEIDAIGIARSEGQHAGLNVVTTLLSEMDGIMELKDVFVLAATNRPDVIDSALTRPGRLDKMLYVGPPELEARRQILEKQVQKMLVGDDLDISALAEVTDGHSGAELMEICRCAALAAIKESERQRPQGTDGLSKVGRKHFDTAASAVEKAITPQMLAFFADFRASRRSWGAL